MNLKDEFEGIEKRQHKRGAECYRRIERIYAMAEREIVNEIKTWYNRFAENNQITLAEARQMLRGDELEEFRWTVEDYIRYGRENAMNGEWMKELENASAHYHVSRLRALGLQIEQQTQILHDGEAAEVGAAMRDVYSDGYYRSVFEIQKGVGVGHSFERLDERKIEKVLTQPWAADGENFEQRIRDYQVKLNDDIKRTITQNIITGADPQKAIDAISDRMGVSKRSAGRMVMTEEAYFSSEAQRDCFRELDVEEYEIVATLDSHTSDICRELDGKVFTMAQWEVGVTAPPFHQWCRTTTCPYFDDDYGQVGERAARGEGGTYNVPADMTYEEWKKKYVK